MFNKAFREGFVGGFSSPLSLFKSSPVKRSREFNGSVEKAWSDVGRALSEATRIEGEKIGKATGTKKSKHDAAA